MTTDPVEIAAILEPAVRADPVAATMLGTIQAALHDGIASEPWCARSATALAVRSSRAHPVVLTADWVDRGDVSALVELFVSLPELKGVSGPVRAAEEVAHALADRRPELSVRRMSMRLFRLDRLTAPAGVAGVARLAGADDRGMLLRWFRAFAEEAEVNLGNLTESVERALAPGRTWLWTVDGAAVSMAVRRPPEGGSARVGPVYTPLVQRGHRFGSAVTAAATRDVLHDRAIPVLFTDLANPTSNKIYQRLGYRPVQDQAEFAFH